MPSRHSDCPKVSVVISTYNRPEMLNKALASVHAQTFDDFEVVVVDDCSPDQDAMRAVLEKWYYEFEKRGIELVAARLGENSGYQCMPKNKGIELARGDYIAYLDDDNTWRPNHLAVAVNAIEYSPANETEKPGEYSKPNFSIDLVYTRIHYVADQEVIEKLQKSFENRIPLGDAEGTEWNPMLLNTRNYIDTSTILHSKGAFWRLVRESGYGWDETLRRFGDWNFVWRWGVFGLTAKLVDAVTLEYFWHADNLQLTRPCIETPVCLNYAQYISLRKDRDRELHAALSLEPAASGISNAR